MAVSASDIVIYGAANMVESDSGTVGGAIDRGVKILTTDMQDVGGTDTLEVVSDDVTDTGGPAVTVTGRLANGVIDTEVFTLTGTTQVVGAKSFERILKVVLTTGTLAGTVTVREASGNQTICTLESAADAAGGEAITEVRRPFYGATANASGGASKSFYEKVFVANNHASLALLNAAIELTADGTTNDVIDFDLEDANNDNNTSTNRLTEPTGMQGSPTWNDSAKNVPGTNLGDLGTGTSDHIGVWLRMVLPAGESPENTNITLTVTGSST